MTTITSRVEGVNASMAIKVPCKATSDSNLTLAGEQTIDGIACVTGDRVLVKSQSTGADNGIYIVSTSSWTRADDFNGARDVVKGTRINVTGGTNAGDYLISTEDPITVSTTSIAFSFVPVTEITDLSQLDGDSDDIAQGSTNLYMSLAEKSKLAGIDPLAEANDDIVAGSGITVTGGNGASWTIAGGAASISLDGLSDVDYGSATVNGGRYAFQYDTTGGGVYNDLLLGSLSEQGANSVTITGGNATLAGGTFADIITEDLQASGSAGVVIKNSGGTQVADFGPANGTGVTFAGNINANAINSLTTPLSIGNGGIGVAYTDPNADRILFWDDSAGNFANLAPSGNVEISGTSLRVSETIAIAISDETTAITTGTAKVTFRMPYAFTLTAVRASLTTVSSSGNPTFDINENGSSILGTKLSIDANEKTSTTAASAVTITDSSLADDAEITIDIDTAGTGAAGAKIYLIGYRT